MSKDPERQLSKRRMHVPVWSQLWNDIRLEWEQRFGKQRIVVNQIVRDLRKALAEHGSPEHGTLKHGTHKQETLKNGTTTQLTDREHALIAAIRKRTETANRNNLTRTAAYLEFYQRNPEIHWSLLAHCVSRNGGYGMTDVQGEWFARTAKADQKVQFFAFLERANWLIFQDAFPQLLLYEEGKRLGTNLSYLLPSFAVSKFMDPMWNFFWEHRDEALLTRALIINEQNYIDSRVAKNPLHESAVEASIQFQVQSLLNLNQVLLPYRQGRDVRLAGTTVEHFTSIDDRIRTGLRLYRILFGDRIRNRSIYQFACEVCHSGSRSDYWPHIFTATLPMGHMGHSMSAWSSTPYEPHLTTTSKGNAAYGNATQGTQGKTTQANATHAKGTQATSTQATSTQATSTQATSTQATGTQATGTQATGTQATATRGIYSPRLQDVWEDVQHKAAEPGDWFHDLRHAIYLFEEVPKQPADITADYVNSIKTIEGLIVAKEKAQAVLPG